jgi:hypothetical protein
MNKPIKPALAALALALAAAPALADDVSFKGLKYSDVKIDKIEGDEIYFTTTNGQSHKPIGDQLHITITGDANLNNAEDAFAAMKWADAADGYARVLKTGSKPWLKDYAAARLQKSAEKAGRFDSAVSAWLYLVQKDTAAAIKAKPAPPANPNSEFIRAAEAELDSAASAVRTDEARQAILSYELELARYQKDDASIQRVAASLIKMGAVSPSTLLGLIHADIDARKFPAAQQKLAQLKAPLADPALENDRLFCVIEITNFTAPASTSAEGWQDIALEYMRVVANDSGGTLTPLSLLRVAALHEKFGDNPTALNIYTQIQKDYQAAPEQQAIVAEAQKKIVSLKAH